MILILRSGIPESRRLELAGLMAVSWSERRPSSGNGNLWNGAFTQAQRMSHSWRSERMGTMVNLKFI